MRAFALIAAALGVVPFVLGSATAQTAEPDPMILVESERAFARDVARLGIRDGFLSHLAEGSVVFEAGPVDGRAIWEARPASGSRLAWEPVYAEISAGGDLGWTTGPWTFRPGEAEPVTAAGHYVSLWRLGEDGVRRVELDIGIFHEPVPDPLPEPDTRLLTGRPDSAVDPVPVLWEAELREADRALSAAAALDLGAAYAGRGAPDLRVYRMGSLPAVGSAAVELAVARGAFDLEPVGAAASAGGDLGYTYGRVRALGAGPEADPGGYLRIWRRDDEAEWRLALDLVDLSPAPEE